MKTGLAIQAHLLAQGRDAPASAPVATPGATTTQ